MSKITTKSYIVIDCYKFLISMVRQGAVFVKMLTKGKQQVDAMLSYHSKVFVLSITVHPEVYMDTNEKISQMMREVRTVIRPAKKTAARYQFKRFGYAWFREAPNGTQAKHHYHLMLMLDGHKIHKGWKFVPDVLEPIAGKYGLKLFYCEHSQSMMLNRKDHEVYSECLYMLSYFSKVSGKGCKAPASNNYSTSRLSVCDKQTWPGFKNTDS